MRKHLMMAGFLVAGGLALGGCEDNEPTATNRTNTDTYGNVDRGNLSDTALAARKDELVRQAEQQLNTVSDEMHRWMEQTSKLAMQRGENVQNAYRESRDALEKAADNARTQLNDLRQATGENIAEQQKEFADAVANLRKQMTDAQQKLAPVGIDNNANQLPPGQVNPNPGVIQPQPAAPAPAVPQNNVPGSAPIDRNVPSPTPNDQPGQPIK